MRTLVVNSGSSTLKLSLLDDDDRTIAARELAAPRATVDEAQLRAALDDGLGDTDVVGHRIVHGGERFRAAVRIDGEVEAQLRELADLAPLHQPQSLAALDAVTAALPSLPAVACFDTAFHANLSAAAATYALPAPWRERYGIRRYGFHGLSHAWVARRAPALLGRDGKELRLVSCHLGSGSSLCAIRDGRSVDTTMGFTPLEGLVMATRSGSIDPGLLLWLLEHGTMSAADLADALEHDSGLKGLCGTADMREVLARAEADEPSARLALDVYIHHLRAGIASMVASLGGIDALVFTGGVGQRSAATRRLAVGGLGFLGLSIDERRNCAATDDQDVSADGASVRSLVVVSREDLEIARQTRGVIAGHLSRR